jgi:hypothetical protein
MEAINDHQSRLVSRGGGAICWIPFDRNLRTQANQAQQMLSFVSMDFDCFLVQLNARISYFCQVNVCLF